VRVLYLVILELLKEGLNHSQFTLCNISRKNNVLFVFLANMNKMKNHLLNENLLSKKFSVIDTLSDFLSYPSITDFFNLDHFGHYG
jgi:hypothetical protein